MLPRARHVDAEWRKSTSVAMEPRRCPLTHPPRRERSAATAASCCPWTSSVSIQRGALADKMGLGRQDQCRECKKAYYRSDVGRIQKGNADKAWRLRNPEKYAAKCRAASIAGALRRRDPRNAIKTIAQQKVTDAVRRGRLQKPDRCSSCGRTGIRLDGHHEDYSKPLEVKWLCVQCHSDRHRQINAAKAGA